MDWLQVNSRVIVGAAIVIAVAAAGYWFYIRSQQIKTINAENVATLDDVKRILTSLPVGVTSVNLIVERTALMLERESRDVSLHGRCRSDRARWEAKKKALEAMKDGRWNDCFLGMREVIQEWGGGLTGDIEVRGL